MGKLRAVKVVSRREGGVADRGYEREFEAIQRYEEVSHSHASLMPIVSVGQDPLNRFFYYSMELADDIHDVVLPIASTASTQEIATLLNGYEPHTLRAELRLRRRLPAEECIERGISLATALEQVHANDLIHRDIKPDNIIFVHGCPKLADVGLVADVEATYSLAGTVAYLSPEHPRGMAADLFALGKVLYEMVTGRDAAEFPAPPLDLGEWNGEERRMFNELNEVILKACQPEVADRYPSAKQMREELELLKEKGGSVLRLRELDKRDRHLQRLIRMVLGVSGALVCVALLAFFTYHVWAVNRRAIDESLHSLMREIQISRMQLHTEGWFTNYWSRLGGVAASRKDNEVLSQASALLAGLDARAKTVAQGFEASSAAFANDGRVLVGGSSLGPPILMETNGVVSVLPGKGIGPVGWTIDNEPVQFITVTNGLILRNAITGKVKREFPLDGANPSRTESDPVLAIMGDATLAAASLHGRLVVWKAEGEKRIGEIGIQATALAFNADGSLIAAGTEDGTTHVYTLPGLVEVAVLSPALRGNPISCVAFGRDPIVRYGQEHGTTNSRLLAVGDKGAGIVIWDLTKRLPRIFCRGSTWTVGALAFSPDGLILASAGRNQPILWDVTSGQPLLQLSKMSSGTSSALAFDRMGHRLLTGGFAPDERKITVLWELERHRGIHALRGMASPVRKVWFSPNSKRVAALSDDWHLGIWDLDLNRLLFIFETPAGVFADTAAGCFGPDSAQFAFAAGHEARLYDLVKGDVPRQWSLNEGVSDQFEFDSNARLLLLRREQSPDRRIWIWRLQELGAASRPVLMHEQVDRTWSAEGVALSPRAERFMILSGGPKGEARILHAYDVKSGRELWKTATEMNEDTFHLPFDPTGSKFGFQIAIPSGGYHLRIFRSADFAELGTTPRDCEAIAPYDKGYEGNVSFFPGITGEKRAIPLTTEWRTLGWVSAFSPSGNLLVWGTEDGIVLVADLQEVQQRLSTLGR
jgi:WD40 repeat protein